LTFCNAVFAKSIIISVIKKVWMIPYQAKFGSKNTFLLLFIENFHQFEIQSLIFIQLNLSVSFKLQTIILEIKR